MDPGQVPRIRRAMHPLQASLLVGLGGFVGAVARYLLAGWLQAALGMRFPMGTFLVNISGAFAIGVLGGWMLGRQEVDGWRLLVGVGFLGGYTTFSSMCWESRSFLQDGEWGHASLNLVLSCVAGMLAVQLGYFLARRLF